MKSVAILSVFSTLLACVLGHDDHENQMPLGYVKYPYQAMYPGDNDSMYHANCI